MAQRRLAAIMFTDIVGYTSLMGSDEDRAFEVLAKNREIHTKLIKQFNGTLIKEMGDGMLISFNLAADAVHCAIEIQKKAKNELNAQVRIGIHLGDIMFENDDVFGDGVNIASRLQSITDPGGIYLSESLQKSIRGKIDIQTKYLGEFNLKNVNYPVKIYSVQGEDLPIPTSAKIKSLKGKSVKERIFRSVSLYAVLLFLLLASVWWTRNEFFIDQPTITSLVVLPFDNFTGDDELEYFVAGMHSSLISDIGKISALRVISKTTSNAYIDADKSMPEIASELGVNAVIEGSVLCLGDTICFQVKVVSAYPEEQQLWVQEFRVEKSQILNLYNTVTKEISNEINVILTPEEERLLAKSRTVDREAYEDYLKARSYVNDFRKESLFKALDYLNSAIEKEPDWAPLYAGLAELWMNIQLGGYESPSVAAPKISENLNKAMELDPDLAEVHYLCAMNAHWVEWNWEKSEKEFLKTLAINPNDSWSRLLYSQLLLILQRNDEALAQRELAAGLDPLNPAMKLLYSGTLVQAGDFAAALSVAEELVAADPMDMNAKVMVGIAAYHLGEYDKVIKSLKHTLPFSIEEDVYEGIVRIYNESGIVAAYEELMKHMEKYAESNPISFSVMSGGYIIANQPDKAMDWIEKGFELHDPKITYITASGGAFEQLFGNPRFIAIVKKMNLPLP